MNKKGQALVEFILILPVLIFILLLVIDMGRIKKKKNHLEVVLNDVSEGSSTINDKEYKIDIKIDNNYIELKSCIDLYTPGLDKIIGNPTCFSTSKELKGNGE